MLTSLKVSIQGVKHPDDAFVDQALEWCLTFALSDQKGIVLEVGKAPNVKEKKFTTWTALRKVIKKKIVDHHSSYERDDEADGQKEEDPDLRGDGAADEANSTDEEDHEKRDGPGELEVAMNVVGVLTTFPKVASRTATFLQQNPLKDAMTLAMKSHGALNRVRVFLWREMPDKLSVRSESAATAMSDVI
eukprot:2913544-Pyramimonas_sp.AAC.1